MSLPSEPLGCRRCYSPILSHGESQPEEARPFGFQTTSTSTSFLFSDIIICPGFHTQRESSEHPLSISDLVHLFSRKINAAPPESKCVLEQMHASICHQKERTQHNGFMAHLTCFLCYPPCGPQVVMALSSFEWAYSHIIKAISLGSCCSIRFFW